MSKPRIEPLPVSEMRPEWEATMARIPGKGLKGTNAPVNVIGTLMHAPETLGTFLEYWVTSKQVMSLSVREQELVILRMGVLYKSEYVWRHHVPVAEEFGVTGSEIDAVLAGGAAYEAFAAREHALLALTDEIVERRTIGDDAWARHAAALPKETVLELIGLVAQYVLFAVTNNAYRTDLEPPMLAIRGLR
jgi:4-carboxymuconolactone decarboxylase